MKKALYLSCLMALVFFFVGRVSAQENDVATNPSSEAVAVTTTSVTNAKIIEQQGHALKISFDLSNQTNIQPGVKYAAVLLEPNGSYFPFPLHQKNYTETLILKAG